MRAKKSFGQHFLVNETIAKRIAESLTDCDFSKKRVLEVGPGKGMLTKYLIELGYDLKVVEADKDMVAFLENHFQELRNRIIFKDFMKLQLSEVFQNEISGQTVEFSLIGNFPYNISSQIVFRMIESRQFIPEMVGMFQKEMAERIIAKPGGKVYGVISILTQAYYSGELLFDVDRQQFSPPPNVQSAVIRLKRNRLELDCDEKLFRQVVKQTFLQRRKMLRNTLKPFFSDTTILEDNFYTKRPETLSVEDFVELTRRIKETLI
jgi:16S rRNA (adenine1518-N6/adenine1519-N6)-dimethyltransferase